MRRLGAQGPAVCPLALGCAAMSPGYGGTTDEAESLATIHAAIDAGAGARRVLIDTANFYGQGHNELLIAKAIRERREEVVLSVKAGALRGPDGAFLGIDNRPAAIRNFIGYSLTRLGVDVIDLYRPARLDPQVPIEDTVGAIAELVDQGYVRHIGLSEMGAETVRRAHAVHPIADLQIEYSLMSRGPEDAILPVLDELGIGVTAYGVLCHGLLSDSARPADAAGGARAHLPRFRPNNFERNRALVAAVTDIAREKGVTTAQLAIAWVLARGPRIVPVIGARRRGQLDEALGALAITLDAADRARIEQAMPAEAVAGSRYAEPLMRMLDSEP